MATESYVNPIAGGGYALLTIVTPDPLPPVAVVGVEDIVIAVERWRKLLANALERRAEGT